MIAARMESLRKRLDEVEERMSDPAVLGRKDEYKELAREHARLSGVLAVYGELRAVSKEIEENRQLLTAAEGDDEFLTLVKQELERLSERKKKVEDELMMLLLPRARNDERNVIVEIRAGTGGGEAGLFVADLFRMYSRYAERRGWKVETMASHPTGIGGFKEIVFSMEGRDVFMRMKYESGVHRVQRVPRTEASGRIHTSAATVAVLPEAEEIEVELTARDLRIDVFRSSGPGGQSVNTTDSAVRITHLPSGLIVTCQDEKSQHKNKMKAMRVLRARLKEAVDAQREREISSLRRSQVSTGDRSEKIRTYNYPQNRVTDHRIGLTLYSLEAVMEGDLDPLLSALLRKDREKQLEKA